MFLSSFSAKDIITYIGRGREHKKITDQKSVMSVTAGNVQAVVDNI